MMPIVSFLLASSDKLLHFIVGMIINMISFYFTENYLYSLFIVVIVALLKEFHDLFVKRTFFSYKDFTATILGSVLVAIYSFFIL